MHAARRHGGSGRRRPIGEQFFLLPPEVAQLLAKHGWGLQEIRTWLFGGTCTMLFGNAATDDLAGIPVASAPRSEEHTSELQSLMRISYAVFYLKKKHKPRTTSTTNT